MSYKGPRRSASGVDRRLGETPEFTLKRKASKAKSKAQRQARKKSRG